MKENIILASVFLLSIFFFVGYSADNNIKINEIKLLYKENKSNEKTYIRQNIPISTDDGEESNTIYKSNGEIIEICHSNVGPSDCGESTTIFYKNFQPFFILYEFECYVNEISTKDINRYYLDNGKIIQYLKGNSKKNIIQGSDEFKNAETMVWI